MSQHAFEQEARLIIKVLQNAHAQIAAIDNSEMDARKYAILNDLSKHANVLRLELGEDIPNAELQHQVKTSAPPLTKLFGREIKPKQAETPVEDTTAGNPTAPVKIRTSEEVEVEELRKQIDKLLPRFIDTDTDVLLDREPDIVLRGVAKRAGLPVTDKNPKNMNAKYVETIKTALKKKAELEALGRTSLESEADGNSGQ